MYGGAPKWYEGMRCMRSKRARLLRLKRIVDYLCKGLPAVFWLRCKVGITHCLLYFETKTTRPA